MNFCFSIRALSLRLFGEDITPASRKEKEKVDGKKGTETTESASETLEVLIPEEEVELGDIANGSGADDS